MSVKLTVFFDGQFWVGVFEKSFEGKYQVSKVLFGAEPKDYEVYDMILKNYYSLRFSDPIIDEEHKDIRINPKRLQREIKRELETKGAGTKAQNALKKQYEENKKQSRVISKGLRDETEKVRFEQRQQKKKEKKKGH